MYGSYTYTSNCRELWITYYDPTIAYEDSDYDAYNRFRGTELFDCNCDSFDWDRIARKFQIYPVVQWVNIGGPVTFPLIDPLKSGDKELIWGTSVKSVLDECRRRQIPGHEIYTKYENTLVPPPKKRLVMRDSANGPIVEWREEDE
jgi:hypothetical protein